MGLAVYRFKVKSKLTG